MSAVKREVYFRPEAFKFFRETGKNNNRPWFHANRERYEDLVRRPFLRFIRDFAPHLRRISPHLVASAKPVGGSLFKIQRDVRFTRDKRPYKTWASARFYHERARDSHTPGFYLHVEEDDVHAAAGVWRPPSLALGKIRNAIVHRPEEWKAATRSRAFKEKKVGFWGEKLKRAPTGFRMDHELIEDLKWKDHIVYVDFKDEDVLSPDLMPKFVEACRTFAPFDRFLADALGLPF